MGAGERQPGLTSSWLPRSAGRETLLSGPQYSHSWEYGDPGDPLPFRAVVTSNGEELGVWIHVRPRKTRAEPTWLKCPHCSKSKHLGVFSDSIKAPPCATRPPAGSKSTANSPSLLPLPHYRTPPPQA